MRRAAAALTFAALAWAAPGWCAKPRTVIIRPPDANATIDEAITRLNGELGAAGFDASILEGTGGCDEERARDRDALAAVCISPREAGAAASVTVVDALTHKTLVRRIDVDASSPEAATVLAVRAVELLRASLLEASHPPKAAAIEPIAPVPHEVSAWMRATEAPAPREREDDARFSAGVAVGVLHGLDGVPVHALPMLRVAWGGERGWQLRASVGGPSLGADSAARAGSASLREALATAGIGYAFSLGALPVSPYLALEAGAYHLDVVGVPASGFVGHREGAWSVLVVPAVGLALDLGNRAALVADFASALVLPPTTIAIDGEASARVGIATPLATLGLRARF